MASLSDQETAFVSDLQRVLSSPGADDQYDQREESYGGRLLNADLARELSRDYRTKFDRLVFTTCSYPPCADYILHRFRRKIGVPGRPGSRAALFLAGGAASGKTSSVGSNTIRQFELVYDSNLATLGKARMMIDECLTAGWFVEIRYIHRPYELAVRSMIDRAIEYGRYVPLGPPSKLARLHMDAQKTICALRNTFASAYVGISAYENLWTPTHQVDATPIALSALDIDGRYHYKDIEELHAIEAQVIASYREIDSSEEGVFQALAEVEI